MQAAGAAASRPTAAVPPTERLEAILDSYAAAGRLHGAALVAVHGHPIVVRAWGEADVVAGLPNRVETRFDLFSVTKSFTAILVLQLVEEGEIDLDDPITAYLPEYRNDTGALVSIHHLLSHSHGIPDISYDGLPPILDLEPPALLASYASGDLRFRPGTRFEYSGLAGFTILGAIIERVAGAPYEAVLHERILDPLELRDTGFLDGRRTIPGLATSYLETTAERRTAFFRTGCNGASSIYSTVSDLQRWFEAVVTHRLLSPEMTAEMLRPRTPPERPFYGLGWYATTLELGGGPRAAVSAAGGGCNVLLGVPADGNVVILLNNVRVPGADGVAEELLAALYE